MAEKKMKSKKERVVHTGRGFDRLIGFTDAVVAVAITLLILSLVDIRGDSSETTVWQIMSDHSDEIFTFVFTFFVVAVMWRTHIRIMNQMRGYDEPVFWLNLAWMIGVVFLPWPSAMYGEGIGASMAEFSGGEGLGGAGMLYWGTLTFIAIIGACMSLHVNRNPEMLVNPNAATTLGGMRGFTFAAAFVIIGVLTLVIPLVASWLPMLFIPLTMWMSRKGGQWGVSEAEAAEMNRAENE